MMRTLTYAAVALAVIVGAATAMAQSVQPTATDAAIAVQAPPPAMTGAPDPTVGWGDQPGGMYDAYGQPNQIYGMPGAGQASASSHPAPQ
jgi:hypothetical protein